MLSFINCLEMYFLEELYPLLSHITEAISDSSLELILLFCVNFLKAISILLIGLLPWPKAGDKVDKALILGTKISAMYLLVLNPCNFASHLLSIESVVQLCSSIASRWAIIIVTGNLVGRDSRLRPYSVPFGIMLYFLRMYELAMTASPNMLPSAMLRANIKI
nr:hypothetical protein [Halimeda borneensis]